MSCLEISPLVPRFFDGELDGRQMRTVALHVTRCTTCEEELRGLERIQDLVADEIAGDVDGVDFVSLWQAVSDEIGDVHVPWHRRLRAWWDELEAPVFAPAWPAFAAAAAVFVTFALWPGAGTQPTADLSATVAHVDSADSLFSEVVDDIDNSAVFESIVGSVDRLMIEPETQTAVLWVSDTGALR